MILIFDLDQTLVESSMASPLRNSRRWQEVYSLIESGFVKPFEGISDLLGHLKLKDHIVAIVTSSPSSYANRIIKKYNWHPDIVVCYHDTVHHKPHAEPLLFALDRISEKKGHDVLSFGDRDIDIIASKNAKIKSVGCLWGCLDKQGLLSSKPDFIANKVLDIYKFI